MKFWKLPREGKRSGSWRGLDELLNGRQLLEKQEAEEDEGKNEEELWASSSTHADSCGYSDSSQSITWQLQTLGISSYLHVEKAFVVFTCVLLGTRRGRVTIDFPIH